MKRDMDLVRYILIAVENTDGAFDGSQLCEGGAYTLEQIAFHVELMKAHGLLEAEIVYAMEHMPVSVEVQRLTWDGCDYLDAVRSDTVWRRSKEAIKEAVGDAPLSVIKSVCTSLATTLIMQNLGI